MLQLNEYNDTIFDCDGVILDSNRVKTIAFKEVTLKYGEDIANAFVDYHKENGGVSRYKKFEWLFQKLLKKDPTKKELLDITARFANIVSERMLHCKITPNLEKLKKYLSSPNWSIVSGGDQTELRHLLKRRGLTRFFNSGVYGSPRTKHMIFEQNFKRGIFSLPAIYFGDSRLDYEVANEFNMDFVFISSWTEFSDWKTYSIEKKIHSAKKLKDLIGL